MKSAPLRPRLACGLLAGTLLLAAPAPAAAAESPTATPETAAPAPAAPPPAADTPLAPEPPAAPAAPAESGVPDIATITNKARSYLGTEEALTSIHSVHYVGTVTNLDGTSRQIDVIMVRPMIQRMTQVAEDHQEVTVLNDYEAWTETTNFDARRSRTVRILGPNEVRVLRMRTWQTLYYYKDIDAVGGEAHVLGEEVVDGVPCVKVQYIHGRGLGYTRYFAKDTGRLVVTKSSGGGELRESGEMFVAGVRFPKEVTESTGDQTSKFVIDRVTVNEEFPGELFEFPVLRFRQATPAPAPPAAAPERPPLPPAAPETVEPPPTPAAPSAPAPVPAVPEVPTP